MARQNGRRIQNYVVNWKFQIGEAVGFDSVRCIVLSKQCSAMGRQIYHLWMDEKNDGRPYRWVAGDALGIILRSDQALAPPPSKEFSLRYLDYRRQVEPA